MSFSSTRREKDLTKLMKSGYKVEMINDDMQEFYVEFRGPKECPYHGGVWRVRVALPDTYPHKSPSIDFVNKIYHPNVDEMSGAVCLNVINHVWNPTFDLVKVFGVFLPQLLLYPNPSDPLNGEAAALMMRDLNAYEQRVKEYCEKYAKTEEAGVSSEENTSNEEPSECDSRKRKLESQCFSGMLKWLHHVAKHSDDPAVGSIPESSKWSKYGSEKVWVQALSARDALLIRRHSSRNAGEHLQQDQQKKTRMHPTIYEDNVLDHQWTEKLRCSKRIRYSAKNPLCPCCSSVATPETKDFNQQHKKGNNLKSPEKPVAVKIEEIATSLKDCRFFETPSEKQVSVGPSFQATVPEWTGVISETDPKWLGTRMWPLENSDGKSTTGCEDLIENGNWHSCTCSFPDSVECVRFHIAENRMKLKRELGAQFHHWRFDRMGEEVSLSWTREEEKIFKDMMRSNAAIRNKFWKNGSRLLPSKTREQLVSYYFNVFLVQRRCYQNRVTPKDVDSDDDEKECGVVGGSFGYKALYIPGSSSVVCTLNQQDFGGL